MGNEPGNETVYITLDRKIVGKMYIVASAETVQSFVDDVNDSSPHYVLYMDTINGPRR